MCAVKNHGATVKLSVVIPAHNEEGCVQGTVEALVAALTGEEIPHEIVVINDGSSDRTEEILQGLSETFESVRYVNNTAPNGFGFAVRRGLDCFQGDAVAVFMADASDAPEDLVLFYRTMANEGVDCVFGTRWSRGGQTIDYPLHKRLLNRLANHSVRMLLRVRCDDITNAFKLYRREVIDGCRPFLSHHFNLTVELPLKAVIRGYSYVVVPNRWTNRTSGVSKLKIKEMGSRYLFIVLYCLLEKWLSRGDYRRGNA